MEQEKHTEEQEIDLIEIAQKLWKNRKFILRVTGVFAILGLLVAISSPNIYTASCTMVPQTGEKSSGGSLSGLAAMAGINLSSIGTSEVLSPTVYPKILSNVNFQKELIYSKYHFKASKEPITLYEHYTDKRNRSFNLIGTIKKYTIGLPGVIIGAIKRESRQDNANDSSAITSLTEKEEKIVKSLNQTISLTLDAKQGFITLTASMKEPLLTAEVAKKAQELLQKYITEFKIEKVAANLKFVEMNYEEAKKNFEEKQIELALFRDANKGLSSAIARTQEEKLTSEYNLLLGVYTELAKQKEQAKIEVTKTTPILTVIQPVTVPTEKSKPKRSMTLVLYIFFGLIAASGWILSYPVIQERLKRVREK